MMRVRNWFTLRANYTNLVDYYRAAGLIGIGWFLIGLALVWGVLIATQLLIGENFSVQLQTWVILTGIVCFALALIYLVQSARLVWASWLLVGFLFGVPAFLTISAGLYQPQAALLVFTVIAAGLLLNRRSLLGVMGASILIAGLSALQQSNFAGNVTITPADSVVTNFGLVVTVITFTGFLMVMLAGNLQAMVNQSLRSIEQLKVIGRFAGRASTEDGYRVLAGLLNLIQSEMGHDFAQLFLSDETGSLDRRLRPDLTEREGYAVTSFRVGDVSGLNEAARTRRPVLISAADAELRRSHFLPSSRYGLALPLLVDKQLIGVLDVQNMALPFSPAQIEVLAVLAEQGAALFERARLARRLQQSLLEQQTANDNLRDQLRSVRQAERQATSSVWDMYLERRGQRAIGFDLNPATGTLVPANDLSDALLKAFQAQEVEVDQQDDAQEMVVPVILRGQVIGSMTFNFPLGEPVTDRQKEIAQLVADRLALALDNRRLFEQSQSLALRERKANEINNLLIGATDVDAVMSIAASSFNEVLGAIRTRVYLQADVLSTQQFATVEDGAAQNGEGSV